METSNNLGLSPPESQLLNIYQCEKSESVNHFSHVRLFVTPRTVACQAPLSKGFSRQIYWNGLPFLPPEYLADPGIEPLSPVFHALQVDSLPAELLRNLFYPNRDKTENGKLTFSNLQILGKVRNALLKKMGRTRL